MTAPRTDIRHQTSDFTPEGLPRRAPFLIAGAVIAGFFGWQSCQVLIREPAHPPAAIEDNDYPLEPGLIWIYKSGTGLQVVRRVVSAQHIGRVPPHFHDMETWFEVQFDLPLLGRRTLLMHRIPEGGVMARRSDREQLIMRFPMKPGDSWTIDFPEDDLAECTVLEPEEIDVLKKRVTASKLRINRTDRKSGKKTTDYEWYARGIGLARMQVTYGLRATFELERFEKAK